MIRGVKELRILISGGTGLIGRALTAKLLGQGHLIAVLEHLNPVKNLLGDGVRPVWGWKNGEHLIEMLEWADVVINLSGKSIDSGRWSAKTKSELINSRILVTQKIADGISKCATPPRLLISASAVGYYGDGGESELREIDPRGSGFLAELCEEWERVALTCQSSLTRVCLLRLGIVLSREGGMLMALSTVLALRTSIFFGSGKQFLSWVHLADVVRMLEKCIDDSRLEGAINSSSPTPVSSKQFASELGKITKCKLVFGLPGIIPKLMLGGPGGLLTQSQRVLPQKLIEAGYEFIYPTLESALNEEFSGEGVSILKIGPSDIDQTLLGRIPNISKANYQLETRVPLNQPPKTVFPFFSSALNLGSMTPSWVGFEIIEFPKTMEVGARIRYRIRLGFIKINWVTEIIEWNPDRSFTDSQLKGPYRLWIHEHKISPDGEDRSVMSDRVIYGLPFGIFGRMVHKLFVKRTLLRIFQFRRQVIQFRF